MNAPQTTFILRGAQDERVFLLHPVFGAETPSPFVVSLSNHGPPFDKLRVNGKHMAGRTNRKTLGW